RTIYISPSATNELLAGLRVWSIALHEPDSQHRIGLKAAEDAPADFVFVVLSGCGVRHRQALAPMLDPVEIPASLGDRFCKVARCTVLLEQLLNPVFLARLGKHGILKIVDVEQPDALLIADCIGVGIERRNDEGKQQSGEEPGFKNADVEFQTGKAIRDTRLQSGGDRITDNLAHAL